MARQKPDPQRVQWTYGGRLKQDYTGAHVMYTRAGRSILGTVTGTYRDEDEVLHFTIRHFNGEPAPDVPCGAVRVLLRDAGGARCPA